MSKSVFLSLRGLALAVVLLSGTPLLALSTHAAQPILPTSPDQSAWSVFSSPGSSSMYALDMDSATDGWAGGTGGNLWHYSGGTWTGVQTDFNDAVLALDMVDGSNGWGATYQGNVIHWDGSTWTVFVALAGVPLNDVFMVSASDGWIVDGIGRIYRYTGGAWVQYSSSSDSLEDIDMLSATDGWAVGDSGQTVHWNGATWTPAGLGVGVWLFGVDAVSATDVWAVGDAGRIYHYNGVWTQIASPTTNNLTAIQMLSPTNGWIMGDSGTILHYDGTGWQLAESPTIRTMYAISLVSPTDGWAIGRFGAILRYTGFPASLATSTKTADKAYAAPGDAVTYTINVRNTGDNTAPAIIVTDATPIGATYVVGSASTSRGTIQGTDPLVVNLGDLEGGGQATITFQVNLVDLGQACWIVSNHAVLSSQGVDLTRSAATVLGDCPTVFLPIVMKGR